MKVSDFNNSYLFKHKIMPTITSKWNHTMTLYDKPIYVSDTELIKWWSFPQDYDFNWNKVWYIVGMSVPPLMTYWIANEIYKQWISNFKI
jgi:DNA (cytosine-5)-methyltransferase 1